MLLGSFTFLDWLNLTFYIEKNERISKSKWCSHEFHTCCYKQWLNSHPSCPYCRRNVLCGNAHRRASEKFTLNHWEICNCRCIKDLNIYIYIIYIYIYPWTWRLYINVYVQGKRRLRIKKRRNLVCCKNRLYRGTNIYNNVTIHVHHFNKV